MAVKPVSVERIAVPEGSGVNFGASISGLDIENLSGMLNLPNAIREIR
jgi:hypothetical protein